MDSKHNRALKKDRQRAELPGSSPGWTSHYPELSEVVHNSSSVGNQWEEKTQMKKSEGA